MNPRSFRFLAALIAAALLLPALPASACSICMGGTEGNTAQAMNSAIFLMLACIGSMLTLISAVAFSLYRRAQRYEAEHGELRDLMLGKS